jgi:hypothetical protein
MKVLVGSFILAASALFVSAQDKPVYTPEPRPEPQVKPAPQWQPAPQGQPMPAQAAKVIAELAGRTGGVRNSPFSADEVNESVQTLADGNRIVRNTTGKIYRNSAGRVRRDMPGGTGGMMGTSFSGPAVTLLDKAGGFSYQLDNNLKIAQPLLVTPTPDVRIRELSEAQRAAVERNRDMDLAEKVRVGERMKVELDRVATTMPVPSIHPVPPIPPVAVISGQGMATTILPAPMANSKYESRTEELGTQNIEGVEAEGKRTITTIPAGAIGNDRPIEIVYERWYSPELKMIVMSKRSDPRMGEQTYRLTNINRSEPDPSLFSVNGYRLVGPPKKAAAYATTSEKAAKKPATLPKYRFTAN